MAGEVGMEQEASGQRQWAQGSRQLEAKEQQWDVWREAIRIIQ